MEDTKQIQLTLNRIEGKVDAILNWINEGVKEALDEEEQPSAESFDDMQ